MDALEALRTRRSIRQFETRAVPREALETLVDAGRLAPTAMGKEPWEFVVVTDSAMRRQIAALTDYGHFIADAPACIVVFCRDVKYYLEDGCAAVENILIAARALGLGSCWVAGDKKPYARAVGDFLGAPKGMKLIALIAVGYPRGPVPTPRKRPLQEVIHWEHF